MTLKQLKTMAEKIGATVDQCRLGLTNTCRVMAPVGYHWVDGVHELVDDVYAPYKNDYKDLMERMKCGIVKCDEDSCQLWHDDIGCEWWCEEVNDD